MKRIFLSRPNWVAEGYLQGLKNFIQLLHARGLDPRTIGVTDQPTMSPMDEVIKLMRKCEGAIILGFPQIRINEGLIKDIPVKDPISLATEWNHIEAALAHTLNLPILLIHDSSVIRGVFDRGATNIFLYSVDFSNESWPHGDDINGAIDSWSNRLDEVLTENEASDSSTPTLKWGCYQFEGRDGLYCPACYEMHGKMIPAARLAGGHYKCPVCGAELS
ncbi:MAG: hypothetical protein FVQ79_10090 [Planctomycetes bacterium]|nr:hypothetical protein [Planctomycetota bacterium]